MQHAESLRAVIDRFGSVRDRSINTKALSRGMKFR